MSETGEGPRKPESGELVYRYNRERRLAEAPDSVRWLESRRGAKRPGFFQSLVATRASRLLLFTILGLVLAFNLVPLFTGARSAGSLGGDRYSVQALWYEGRVLVSLRRRGAALPEEQRGILSLSAAAVTKAGGAASAPTGAAFVYGLEADEDFSLAIEGLGERPPSVELLLASGGSKLSLECKVQ